MRGYCQDQHRIVEMIDVQTVRLPNLKFINKGRCKECGSVIYKGIRDREIIINRAGYKFPSVVYVGDKTPSKLIEDANGQKIIKEGKKITTKPKDGTIITVEEIKTKEATK